MKLTTQPNGDRLLTQLKPLQQLFDEFSSELATAPFTAKRASQRAPEAQSSDHTPADVTTYLHLLGSLIYLLKSRLDITTAVCFAAMFAAKPTVAAHEEMLYCLAYLNAIRYLGLLLKAGEPGRDLTLKSHMDASYLTHTDSKSHA